jgi:hypothetical protein
MNNELEKAYDEYSKDGNIIVTQTVTDYAELMRDVLTKLQDGLEMLEATVIAVPNLINLTKTAQDYLFYLEDNRRVIL